MGTTGTSQIEEKIRGLPVAALLAYYFDSLPFFTAIATLTPKPPQIMTIPISIIAIALPDIIVKPP